MYSHTHKHTRTEFKVDYIFPLEMGACKRGEYTYFFLLLHFKGGLRNCLALLSFHHPRFSHVTIVVHREEAA